MTTTNSTKLSDAELDQLLARSLTVGFVGLCGAMTIFGGPPGAGSAAVLALFFGPSVAHMNSEANKAVRNSRPLKKP